MGASGIWNYVLALKEISIYPQNVTSFISQLLEEFGVSTLFRDLMLSAFSVPLTMLSLYCSNTISRLLRIGCNWDESMDFIINVSRSSAKPRDRYCVFVSWSQYFYCSLNSVHCWWDSMATLLLSIQASDWFPHFSLCSTMHPRHQERTRISASFLHRQVLCFYNFHCSSVFTDRYKKSYSSMYLRPSGTPILCHR